MASKQLVSAACRCALTITMFAVITTTYGQVYKKVDKSGNVTFSDQPDPDAVSVEIQETNRVVAVEPRDTTKDPKQPPKTTPYTRLIISNPQDRAIIPNGLVPLPVLTQVSPNLQKKHALQLLLDGQVHSENKSGSFTLPTVARGAHTLQVRVVDEQKKIIKQSATTSIQVYRPGG
jgi:Domain of unknown function (DUF4124)